MNTPDIHMLWPESTGVEGNRTHTEKGRLVIISTYKLYGSICRDTERQQEEYVRTAKQIQ